MSRKLSILGIAALVVIGLFVTAGVAFAQGPVDEAPAPSHIYGMRGAIRFGGAGGSMLNVVADLLDMTPGELIAQIQDGKTLLEVAEDHGLTAEDLADAMLATRIEVIQAMVETGRITQEQADRMIETMAERMLSRISSGDCAGEPGTGYMGGARVGRGGRDGMMGGRMSGAFVDGDDDGNCDLYDSEGTTFGGRWNVQPGQTL